MDIANINIYLIVGKNKHGRTFFDNYEIISEILTSYNKYHFTSKKMLAYFSLNKIHHQNNICVNTRHQLQFM